MTALVAVMETPQVLETPLNLTLSVSLMQRQCALFSEFNPRAVYTTLIFSCPMTTAQLPNRYQHVCVNCFPKTSNKPIWEATHTLPWHPSNVLYNTPARLTPQICRPRRVTKKHSTRMQNLSGGFLPVYITGG